MPIGLPIKLSRHIIAMDQRGFNERVGVNRALKEFALRDILGLVGA